jgi:nitroimidazol reductase NimA-like FMN-containing flavoprotein (pyridoxamine 5'-phosphate oxidase superfamily)
MKVRDVDATAARRLFGGLPVAGDATSPADGSPHVVPLWFVGPDDAIYVSTRRASRTWANVTSDPRVALTIDLGRAWVEIAGIEVRGRADLLPAEHAEMRRPISAWHDKYRSLLTGDGFSRFSEEVRDLGFLRVLIERIAAWDHARD